MYQRTIGEDHGRFSPVPLFFISFIVTVGTSLGTVGYAADFAGRIMAPKVMMFKDQPRALREAAAREAEKPPTPEELQAAQGIEGLLVDLMIQEMRKTVPENELMPASNGERIFKQMLDQEYGKMLVGSGQLGVADLVLAQIRGKR